MDIKKKIGETTLDLIKNENIQNKSAELLGMLFPYAGIKKKAVDMYVQEIEHSNLPTDTKMIALLNAKKTLKKLKNQQRIVDIASINAKEGTDFTEQSGINEEWFDRFMDSAGFVSSEDMQLIWGKILANEFENPGSTPPNMIRVLSEITPSLARAFRKICSMQVWICPLTDDDNIEMSFQKIFVPYNEHHDEFHRMGLSFNVLNELETLGIIKVSTIAGYVSTNITNKKVLLCIGDDIEIVSGHTDNQIPIGNVLLTAVGDSLRNITDPEDVPNYSAMVRKYIEKQSLQFDTEHSFELKKDGDSLMISKKQQ